MRPLARYCGVLFAAALIMPSAQAIQRKAVGVVSQTDRGHIDSADAVSGANVYDCDTLETEQGGQMRMQVRSGQVYLAAASEGQLQEGFNGIDVYIDRGTVGFSAMAGAAIEMVTPAGFVRPANGQAASGEVTITGRIELTITAMRGDLVLDDGGEFRTIPQGQTAKVTVAEGGSPVCREEDSQDQQPRHGLRRPVGFYFVGAGAVIVPSIILWEKLTESASTPKN
ncbi:MAG: hypothetical protein ACLP3K_10080 [Candidatus Acidiferrales bacterium]